MSTIENELAKRDRLLAEKSERIKKLEVLACDMWHELNYECVRAERLSGGCIKRVNAFDIRMRELGVLE